MKAQFVTRIAQTKVKVLKPSDWDRYEANRPGPGWELVEYENKERAWVPDYQLRYGEFIDHSKLRIVEV